MILNNILFNTQKIKMDNNNIAFRSTVSDIEVNDINRNNCISEFNVFEDILKDMDDEDRKKFLKEKINSVETKIEQSKIDIFNCINNKRSVFSLYSLERIVSIYYMQLCYFKGRLQYLL